MTMTSTITTAKFIGINDLIDSVIVVIRDNAKEYTKQNNGKVNESKIYDEMITSFIFHFLIRKDRVK